MRNTTTGERFVESLLAQDWDAAGVQLAERVRYRGVTTSRVTQVTGRDEALAGLQLIFEDGDVVTRLEASVAEALPPVERVTYRFQTKTPDNGGVRRAEQHVFIRTGDDGRIEQLDLICSGWLPVPDHDG